MHVQTRRFGIRHQRCRRAICIQDHASVNAHRIGILRDIRQPAWREHVFISDARLIGWPRARLCQLDKRVIDHLVKPLQSANLETLQKDLGIFAVQPFIAQLRHQQIDHIDPCILQDESRMLELGIDADPAARLCLFRAHQLDNLSKCRHLIKAVIASVGRPDCG